MFFVCWTSLDVLIVRPEVAYYGCSNTVIPHKWWTLRAAQPKHHTTTLYHGAPWQRKKEHFLRKKTNIFAKELNFWQNANKDKPAGQKRQRVMDGIDAYRSKGQGLMQDRFCCLLIDVQPRFACIPTWNMHQNMRVAIFSAFTTHTSALQKEKISPRPKQPTYARGYYKWGVD